MIGRRAVLQSLAALPLLGHAALAAQSRGIAAAPIRLGDDRLWIEVGFGGRGTYPFIIDTGAFMNLISRPLAMELDLNMIGSTRIGGLGGVDRYNVYRAPDASVGGLRVGALNFAAYGPDLLLHPEAFGLLSAGLLTVADSDLDFDALEWRLHLDGRADRSGFVPLASTIQSDGPGNGAAKMLVDVALDGRTYRLEVDTGAPVSIMLTPRATRRSGMWNDSIPYSPHRRRGLGGDGGRARLVRAGTATIGDISFERPIISLTDPDAGLRMESDGLLGMRVIEQLHLSTDIRARRLWVRRNNRPARREEDAMSGLWLGERGGGLVVEEVGRGSPAEAAGLRVGDRIEEGSLIEWILRLEGGAGSVVEIPYRRGDTAGTASLTLRDYL